MKEKLFEQILNEDYETSYNNYIKSRDELTSRYEPLSKKAYNNFKNAKLKHMKDNWQFNIGVFNIRLELQYDKYDEAVEGSLVCWTNDIQFYRSIFLNENKTEEYFELEMIDIITKLTAEPSEAITAIKDVIKNGNKYYAEIMDQYKKRRSAFLAEYNTTSTRYNNIERTYRNMKDKLYKSVEDEFNAERGVKVGDTFMDEGQWTITEIDKDKGWVKAVSPKGRTKKFDFDEVYSDIKSQFIKK